MVRANTQKSTRSASAKDITNTLRRVKRTCERLGILPVAEMRDHERQTLRLRFATDAPAVRLRKELIGARIAAVSVITPRSCAVLIHLDAYEQTQPYTHRRQVEAAAA